jgi:two-component system, cell cycle response regulator DivK
MTTVEPLPGAPSILLAEDDPVSLKLMRDVLRANGYRTCEVSNGLEVVPLALHEHPGLIVLDIGLPGRNGIEVARDLKASPRTSEIPVLSVSAYAMPADETRALQAGCDAYLAKPLRLAELVDVVGRLLRV